MSGRARGGVRVLAPAKINWTLEVLHVRSDGYRELRSVLQTIDLCDSVTISEASDIELVLGGDVGALAGESIEGNLAYRAAALLRERAGVSAGVRIEIEKRIPIAAGLGGGSSDGAAVLRGCNALWRTGFDDAALLELAAEIGSDPPFFIRSGTAAVSSRGEHVESLPDAIAPQVVLAAPPAASRSAKTSSMFAALSPDDFTDGGATTRLCDAIEVGRAIDDATLCNVFANATATMQPETHAAMTALRADGFTPHLAGAGPSFFLLVRDPSDADTLSARIGELGFDPRTLRTMPRVRALMIEDL